MAIEKMKFINLYAPLHRFDEVCDKYIADSNIHLEDALSIVKGIDDMAVRFSRCCNPLPGDEIVGFVTRGRGLTIHRTDCINVLHLTERERARLIPVEWEADAAETSEGKYFAEIKMFVEDKPGMLMEISKVFTEAEIDIKTMNVRTSKKGVSTVEMRFVVRGKEEMGRLVGKLRQIENVIDIERTTG